MSLAKSIHSMMAVCFAALALSACGGSDTPPILMNITSSTAGPDEFSIQPTKPLELPEDLAALPDPTPGGTNRTDIDPFENVAVALGGNKPTGGGGADGALISYASRKGVNADIRKITAIEDLEHRRRNKGRPLERLFGTNTYFNAYAKQQLDQLAELARWRQAGVRTPAAPPLALPAKK